MALAACACQPGRGTCPAPGEQFEPSVPPEAGGVEVDQLVCPDGTSDYAAERHEVAYCAPGVCAPAWVTTENGADYCLPRGEAEAWAEEHCPRCDIDARNYRSDAFGPYFRVSIYCEPADK